MTEKRPPIETEMKKSQGVAAYFSYDGQIYGIPLQSEDSNKFETVVNDALVPLNFGYLRDKKIGLVGGKVEKDETLNETLTREIIQELSEVTGKTFSEIEKNVLPLLKWAEPENIEDFAVVQSTQDKPLDESIFRGIFELFITEIKLDQISFTVLNSVLRPINVQGIEDLRPFLAELVTSKKIK